MTELKRKKYWQKTAGIIVSSLLIGGVDVAFAATNRGRLAGLLIDDMQGSPSLFQGTPITHIVPEFNTVNYALELQRMQTSVLSEYRYSGKTQETLTYSGWKASPYLALSLKKIGLGFNVEAGETNIDYMSFFGDRELKQKSSLSYRGVGIYLFYKPFDWRGFIPSFTLGGKSLNGNHEFGYPMSDSDRESSDSTASKFTYSVMKYSVGVNTQLKVVKPITIIPWADYLSVDDSAAHSVFGRSFASDSLRDDFNDDLRIMWYDRRAFNYGIDFALDTNGFQLRFGGLLGSLAGAGMGSDRIKDQGIRIAFAWNQKG